MVHGYHLIMSAYGFWLPNDPRGSWSDFVGAWELFRFGPATKVETHRSVASRPHNRVLRREAKVALRLPAVHFSGVQARAVARGFAECGRRGQLTVWACSILPDHVHLVIGRHTCKVEQIAILLKGEATRQLIAENLHPFGDLASPDGRVPKCWAQGMWKVFLDTEEDIQRSIRYVEDNPLKEGKPRQNWKFVTPYLPSIV